MRKFLIILAAAFFIAAALPSLAADAENLSGTPVIKSAKAGHKAKKIQKAKKPKKAAKRARKHRR